MNKTVARDEAAVSEPVTLPPPSSLVGREGELAELEQWLEAAQASQGQIVRLEGRPGIGKSRLVTELIERAVTRGFRAAVGHCNSISRATSYTPWRQIFRTLLGVDEKPLSNEDPSAWLLRQGERLKGIIQRVNPNQADHLPLLKDLLDLPIPDNQTTEAFDPKTRQEALLALVAALTQTVAQDQALLLVVEDVHWIDEVSQRLIIGLQRMIAQGQILLILTQRPPSPGDKPLLSDLNHYHSLSLRELSPDQLVTLINNRFQNPLSPLASSLILALSEGNPLFAEVLADALREAGNLHFHNGVWRLSEPILQALREANCLNRSRASAEGWVLARHARLSAAKLDIPTSIQSAVLSRTDHLPETHLLTLKVASVIGRTFRVEVLAQSHPENLDLNPLREQIKFLEERNFIRPTETSAIYIFKHHTIQEVAYESLLGTQQQALHHAVGVALENLEPESVEQLAYHYRQARLRDKMLLYLDQAARKTQREYANETALYYYGQALVEEKRWEWRKGQAEVLHNLARRKEQKLALRKLAAGQTAPAFDLNYLFGQYYDAISEYPKAEDAIERALIASQDNGRLVDEVHCLAQLGLIAVHDGEFNDATVWYNRALRLFSNNQSYSPEEVRAFAQAHNGLGFVHRQQGDFEQAGACYEKALVLSQQSNDRKGEAMARDSLGTVSFHQRKLAEAVPYHQKALEIRREIGDRAGEGASLTNLGQALRDSGDYGQALAYFSEAVAIEQETGNRWNEINNWNDLGILYQELGDLDQAETCFKRSLALSRQIDDKESRIYVLPNLALVMRDRGDLARARRLLEEGLSLAEDLGLDNEVQRSSFLSYLSVVSLYAKKFKQAIEQASAALTMRQAPDLCSYLPDDLATLASTHSLFGNRDQALDYAQQAWKLLDKSKGEGPEFPQRDCYLCHQVFMKLGEHAAARASLMLAYGLVMKRAEKITNPALRQSFLERVQTNREIIQAAEVAQISSAERL